MQIKRDTLMVGGLISDERGDKVEPEQQPVVRAIDAAIQVSGSHGGVLGEIGGRINQVQPAGIFAQDLRRKCISCAHFDRRGFAELRKVKAATISGHRELNELRASLLESGNAFEGQDGDADVEGALAAMGLCRAVGEIIRDDFVVYPLANCPESVNLFKPRDSAADKAGAAAYDHIMRLAEDGEAE